MALFGVALAGLALAGLAFERDRAARRGAAPLASAPPAGTATADPAPVLLIGLDGATFDLIEPLVQAGRMPNIAQLIAGGASGRLSTIEPTLSPAIWTTIATGKLPEAHGIAGFEGVPGETMKTLPTSAMRQVRAFWNILSEHERTVGVVGWWVTWPAEAVDGYVVSDRAAYTRMEAAVAGEGLHPGEVYPEGLAPEIRSRVRRPDQITPAEIRRFLRLTDGEAQALVRGPSYQHGSLLPEFKYVHQADRSTVDIAVHLARTRPTDVTAVALYGIDLVSHLAWHLMEPEKFPRYRVPADAIDKLGGLIESYYAWTDELVGELVAAAPPRTTVIVFSDHGFGPTGLLPWSGGHGEITPGAPRAPDGVLILSGPGVEPGARLDRPHVLDLAPTLLYLEGLPLADDMPGRALTEAFRAELRAARPETHIPTYETTPWDPGAPSGDPELDRDLVEKLRSLGYVE